MQQPQFDFSAFSEIVSTPFDGEFPLVVGGQAVNIWAIAYLDRIGEKLNALAPFTSKDLDLYGPLKILEDLGRKYQVPVELAPPRLPGLGFVLIPTEHSPIKVELLQGVKGIRKIGPENAFTLAIDGKKLRVLDAISCLKAKIANAADLDQAGRQDVRHVQIMKICVSEFLSDLIRGGENGEISERQVVNDLEELREIMKSKEAKKVEQKWKVFLGDVFPLEAIRLSNLEKVKNFAQYRL